MASFNTTPKIDIVGLSFSYSSDDTATNGGKRTGGEVAPTTERTIFSDLNLSLTGHTAILGPSGGGKTTLLRLLSGLSQPAQGRIVPSPEEMAGAMVFQEPRLLPWRTVLQNIGLVTPSGSNEAAQWWLRRLGLEEHAHTLPLHLSGGMRQRVALARAMVTKPSILLVDEPLTGLDRVQSAEVADLLVSTLTELNAIIVLVTHDLDLALRLAERIVVFSGSPAKPILDLKRREIPATDLRRRILDALTVAPE